MMGVEVVVEADVAVGANEGAVAMRTLFVEAVIQALADDAPLYGDVCDAGAGDRERLVDGPACRAMVDDDIAAAGADGDGVDLFLHRVTWAHAQVADDDIVGFHGEAVVSAAAPSSGGGLAGDRDKGLRDAQRFFEFDGT